MKKIVLTGGHAGTTALAVIEELVSQGGSAGGRDKWDIYWIGPKRAFEGARFKTLEAKIFPKMGVAFHPIVAGRLQRRFSIHTIPSIIRIPFGFIHALILLIRIKPKVVLSFGGFAAFPVVVVGSILGIKIIIHEQTVAVGLANKASAVFADKIALARQESKEFFPVKKTVVVGNPVMASVVNVKHKDQVGNPPTLLIMGGSRGSEPINVVVTEALPQLLRKYNVIHLTGEKGFTSFSETKRKNYRVYDFVEPSAIAELYRQADVVVARAGANTVSEIMVVGLPAVLIPIPWARFDEQTKNAQAAEVAKIAIVLPQEMLTGESLTAKIAEVFGNWEKMTKSYDRTLAKKDATAAKALVELL